jgi:hypothetical protein
LIIFVVGIETVGDVPGLAIFLQESAFFFAQLAIDALI